MTLTDEPPAASPTPISLSVIAQSLGAWFYAIVVPPIALLAFPPFRLQFELGSIYLIVAAVPILVGVALVLSAGRDVAKTGRWKSAIFVSTLQIVTLLLTSGLAWPIGPKLQCGAWSLKQGTVLRAIGVSMKQRLDAGQPLPPSMAVELLTYGDRQFEIFHDACGECRYRDVTIGRYSLVDYFAGRVTIEELNAEAQRTRTDPTEWERMGNFVVSRDPSLWNRLDHQVLVGYSRHGRTEGYNVLYADLHVGGEYPHSEDVISAVVAARLRGLPEPPDELLEALKITPEQIEAFDQRFPAVSPPTALDE